MFNVSDNNIFVQVIVECNLKSVFAAMTTCLFGVDTASFTNNVKSFTKLDRNFLSHSCMRDPVFANHLHVIISICLINPYFAGW